MAHTFTVSADKEVHDQYKRFCIDHRLKVSTELQRFMEGEIAGKQEAYNALVNQVDNLQKAVNELTGNNQDKGGF